jgi:hypothetical protein
MFFPRSRKSGMIPVIKGLFISWADSCAGPVSHITVTSVETHHPPPHRPHIHCLVSVNVQQTSINVNGCNVIPHGGMQWYTSALHALPCQTPFYQTAPLLKYLARQQNVQIIGCKVQPLLSFHQHPPLTLWNNIIKWETLLSEIVAVPEAREQFGIPEEGERLPLETVASRLVKTVTEENSMCIPVTCEI